MTKRKRAVFLDFDGTITQSDTFVEIVRRQVPETADRILSELVAGRINLRDGIKEIISHIPTDRLPAMIAQVVSSPRRAGLDELLDFLDQCGAQAVIVSSGLAVLVESHLGSLAERFAEIHAGNLETSGDYLTVSSPFESANELVAKADILRQFGAEDNAAVGDSMTDRLLAKAADVVFARDRLIPYCQADGIPFVTWDDFHDVRRELERRWGSFRL